MTIRAMPDVPAGRPQIDVRSYISPQALNRWDSSIRASAEQDADERTIGIYDVIGHDYWTGEGFTAKRMSAALRSLGKGPVTVSINSPGGDMFEGIAMYSMLKEHKGDVIVKVMGLAASAASVIAMSGDDVQIARPAFLMIHNCWSIGIGNRHDFAALSEQLRPFDEAMADVYAARTGGTTKAMAALMDKETWIGGSAAVEQGFADQLLSSEEVGRSEGQANAAAVRRLESALRASGMPQSEAKKLISEFKAGLRDVPGSGERDATNNAAVAANLKALISTVTRKEP